MHDLPKPRQNHNCDLPEFIKITVMDNFDLPRIKKMTQVTCPKLIIVTSNLLYL